MIDQNRRLPQPHRIVAVTAATLAAMLAFTMAKALLVDGVSADFANKDFANYWMAGKLILSGQTMDLFGPQAGYFRHLTAAFGPGYQWHNWSYPPHYLLLVWPLGFLGYKAAMVAFLAATGLFFAWALRRFAGGWDQMMIIAVAPLMVYNVWTAQNGFLTAGLALAVLAFRDSRPILAGVFLGLLTVKPQLGILFPFLLLAERRWSVLISASVSTIVLVVLSSAIFGIDAWKGYLDAVVPYQTHVMRELQGPFLVMLPSVFGSFRRWGFDADTALLAHMIFAVPVFLLCVASFFLVHDPKWRSAILLLGTFLVTPYALTYDLGMAAVAFALVAVPMQPAGERLATPLQALLAAAMLMPIWMMPLGTVMLAVAPLVLAAVLACVMHRAGLFERLAALSPIQLRQG